MRCLNDHVCCLAQEETTHYVRGGLKITKGDRCKPKFCSMYITQEMVDENVNRTKKLYTHKRECDDDS